MECSLCNSCCVPSMTLSHYRLRGKTILTALGVLSGSVRTGCNAPCWYMRCNTSVMMQAQPVRRADGASHVAGKLEKEVNSAGGESKLKHYVFTHVHFDIAYNGNRIVVSLLWAVAALRVWHCFARNFEELQCQTCF